MHFWRLVLIVVMLAHFSLAFAQEPPCGPCPEGAQCLLPECPEEATIEAESPQIRLWNTTNDVMEDVTVQFMDDVEPFGTIESGGVTEYLAVEEAYSYAAIQMVIDGEPHMIQPIDFIGEVPLEPGFYTYALGIDAESGQVTIELLRPLMSAESYGGLCQYGMCGSLLNVYDNGTVVVRVGSGKQTIMTLDEAEFAALVEAIDAVDIEEIREHPFKDTCPIAYDGQEIIYHFYQGERRERIASCEYEIDAAVPPFSILIEYMVTADIGD